MNFSRTGLRLVIAALVNGAFLHLAIADPTQNLEMFLDDTNIHLMSGVSRQLQQPDRLSQPVITGSGGAWDPHRSFGTVIYDDTDKIYKAWYQENGGANAISYATSVDGLNWTYPNLGLVSYKGSTANNMLFQGVGLQTLYNSAVIKDDSDPDPNKRYKIAYWDAGNTDADGDGIRGEYYGDSGVFTGTSPDGIHWTVTKTPAAPQLYTQAKEQSPSDVVEMMYDSQKHEYVIYAKGWANWTSTTLPNPVADYRQIVRIESSDFVNWSTPQVVLSPDHSTPASTAIDPQFYGMSVFQYEGMYIGLVRSYKDSGRSTGHMGDQTMDVQLAASRDGIHWTRVADDGTFMPIGAPGTWDDGMVLPYAPFEKDGKIDIYYQGWDGVHNLPPGAPPRYSSVGLATIDAGRFVAMTASDGVALGLLETDPFVMHGSQLFLNADLGENGLIEVGLYDANGQPIPGFTESLMELEKYNDLYYVVDFPGSLSALENQSVSLRFWIGGDAALYGYTTSMSAINLAVVPEPAWGGFLVAGLMIAGCFCRNR